MIISYTPSRRGALRRESPNIVHVHALVFGVAERRTRGGRFARTNDTDEALLVLQLMDLSSEHAARRRHDHGVKNILEGRYRSLQAGELQHAVENFLPVNLDDPLTVAGLEGNANLHPHILCTTNLGCTDSIHFP